VFKDYYKILKISSDADSNAIKAAYRKQALEWHPDRHPDMDVKSIMQDINEAYAILKDPQKRARYDEEYKFF
jgi:curved DNA-binding protein CbpA